ncbi:MAG TPA: DUF3592 domain-containing protein [Anaerolineales bacterium]|nr:DUF3592 domain-containing protein [Anaerolineales bacterium]HRF47423.1 DUF3592 domain-containing protein [Anaerolineales bacterium]
MEFAYLITMVVSLVACLGGIGVAVGVATVLLLLTGHGVRRSFNNGFLLGAMPLFVPALLMACNLGFFLPTFEVVREGVVTTGTVVDYEENNNEGVSYASIIDFETADGDKVRFTDTSVSSNPPRHVIGQEVGVIYMADDPERAVVRDVFWWFIPALLLLVAGLAALIGYGLAWRAYRQDKWSTLDFLFDLF